MTRRLRKNRSVRMTNKEWGEVERAASHETERRGDTIAAGTLARDLTLRGARRINARAALLAHPSEMAVAS